MLFKKFREKTYLIPDSIKEWFVRLCINTIRNLESLYHQFGIKEIRNKACGTALTMNIILESGIDICVDMVPVLSFESELLCFYPEVWKNIANPDWLTHQPLEYRNRVLPSLKKNFFAVPKKFRAEIGMDRRSG